MIKLPTQVFVSHSKPEASKITPLLNERFWKPLGGLWTSTFGDDGGEWVRWLDGQNYTLDDPRWGGDLWLLEPKEANLAVVAHPSDLRELCASYPHPELDHFNSLSERFKSFEFVDWERLSQDYDGLHVPNPWPWRFGYGDDFDYAASMFFYTMDAECTCWARWCFEGEPRIASLERSNA